MRRCLSGAISYNNLIGDNQAIDFTSAARLRNNGGSNFVSITDYGNH